MLFERVACLLRHAFWRHLCLPVRAGAARAVRLFTQKEDTLRLLTRYTALLPSAGGERCFIGVL